MTNNLERRLVEHRSKPKKCSYTTSRLPIELVWYLSCTTPDEAISIEKKLKGWTRKKKTALIKENWQDLVEFSKNYTEHGHPDNRD